jgi:hypothetical protein
VQQLRGLISGLLVGGLLAGFLMMAPWIHAARELALVIGAAVGGTILFVVATGTGPQDEAADAAWRETALDLPPASDRVILERLQASIPGPDKKRKATARAGDRTPVAAQGGDGERSDQK